jgi:hypothetical protein
LSLTDKEFDEAVDLFAMPGWKTLMEEIEDQLDLCTIDACNTLEDLYFSKGRAAVLRMLLNYENYVRNIEDEAQDYELQ